MRSFWDCHCSLPSCISEIAAVTMGQVRLYSDFRMLPGRPGAAAFRFTAHRQGVEISEAEAKAFGAARKKELKEQGRLAPSWLLRGAVASYLRSS